MENPSTEMLRGTYDGLIGVLRKITVEIVMSVKQWRELQR